MNLTLSKTLKAVFFFYDTGPQRKNKIMDEETNWCTSYHEAGHALVAYYTKDAIPLHKVTILPRGQSLGHVSFILAANTGWYPEHFVGFDGTVQSFITHLIVTRIWIYLHFQSKHLMNLEIFATVHSKLIIKPFNCYLTRNRQIKREYKHLLHHSLGSAIMVLEECLLINLRS